MIHTEEALNETDAATLLAVENVDDVEHVESLGAADVEPVEYVEPDVEHAEPVTTVESEEAPAAPAEPVVVPVVWWRAPSSPPLASSRWPRSRPTSWWPTHRRRPTSWSPPRGRERGRACRQPRGRGPRGPRAVPAPGRADRRPRPRAHGRPERPRRGEGRPRGAGRSPCASRRATTATGSGPSSPSTSRCSGTRERPLRSPADLTRSRHVPARTRAAWVRAYGGVVADPQPDVPIPDVTEARHLFPATRTGATSTPPPSDSPATSWPQTYHAVVEEWATEGLDFAAASRPRTTHGCGGAAHGCRPCGRGADPVGVVGGRTGRGPVRPRRAR